MPSHFPEIPEGYAMADSTGDNGWGLPSSAFLRSLGPPHRPDLIPPWQDPAERQRAAEAERVRADEEETLQFIQDYVQALRDWRKEIVFHWGDHVIGRTTISLFKNPRAGEPTQLSPVPPTAGDAGTLAADLDRSSPHELDISSAAAPALIGSTASAKAADPTIQASDSPSTPTDSTAVPPGEPTSAPNGGRDGTPMTDAAVKESDPEENLGTAPRPAAEAGAVAGPSARAAIPATVIAADGLWAPPSFLPALPSAEAIIAGLAAVVGSPVTIGAAAIGGILFPTRTAADDTLDGTPFAAVPPQPTVLPGGPPVGLPALPPLAVPTQADRGPVILPGGGPVSLPPVPPFPASQDAPGPLIFPGNPTSVQLPNIVQNEAARATVPPSILDATGKLPQGIGGLGTPIPMPPTADPDSTAERFANDALNGQIPVRVVNGITGGGSWVAILPDGTAVTYRPAGQASDATDDRTATVEINNMAVKDINNGRVAKFKFPQS
jgi:hypothetical protein